MLVAKAVQFTRLVELSTTTFCAATPARLNPNPLVRKPNAPSAASRAGAVEAARKQAALCIAEDDLAESGGEVGLDGRPTHSVGRGLDDNCLAGQGADVETELVGAEAEAAVIHENGWSSGRGQVQGQQCHDAGDTAESVTDDDRIAPRIDRKSTRLNSSH